MKRTQQYAWDDNEKIATYILTDGDNVFVGSACCHPDDYDMCNEKTGLQIASMRAQIKYYTHMRDNEIKPTLKALNKLQSDMLYSKKYNKDSYEAKMLQKHIYRTKVDLDTVQDLLENAKTELRQYIFEKDDFYKRIRSNREKKDHVGQKA